MTAQSSNNLNIIVGVCREDDPRDVDEAYGPGTYARLFPDTDDDKCPTCKGRGSVNPLTDILTRLAALTPEHPVIAELREYIRRGFDFGASTDSRRWILSDEEITAINTGFCVLDGDRSALIALVQEAAGEIERWRKEYRLIHEQYNSAAEKLRQVSKRVEELDPPAPGWGPGWGDGS